MDYKEFLRLNSIVFAWFVSGLLDFSLNFSYDENVLNFKKCSYKERFLVKNEKEWDILKICKTLWVSQ